MSEDINALLDNAVRIQGFIAKDEGNVVFHMVGLGKVLQSLRQRAGGRWVSLVKKLGYHDRIASRYIKLAKSWWGGTGLIESGLLTKLPPDLMKLEWLCRLSRAQLAVFASMRLKEWSRSQVIAEVKAQLNITEENDEPRSSTIDKIKTDCEKFIKRTVAFLEDAPPELADPERRQQLLDMLSAKFAKVETMLADSDEGETSSANVEASAESTLNIVDSDDGSDYQFEDEETEDETDDIDEESVTTA